MCKEIENKSHMKVDKSGRMQKLERIGSIGKIQSSGKKNLKVPSSGKKYRKVLSCGKMDGEDQRKSGRIQSMEEKVERIRSRGKGELG